MTGVSELTRGHEGNKLIAFGIPEGKAKELEEFLNTFLTGDTFSDQLREFVLWTRKEMS